MLSLQVHSTRMIALLRLQEPWPPGENLGAKVPWQSWLLLGVSSLPVCSMFDVSRLMMLVNEELVYVLG